jgi:hypothetical protein
MEQFTSIEIHFLLLSERILFKNCQIFHSAFCTSAFTPETQTKYTFLNKAVTFNSRSDKLTRIKWNRSTKKNPNVFRLNKLFVSLT